MRHAPILSPRATSRAVPEDRLRIQRTLKRLAARGPSPWPVLSVYVNTRPVGSAMTTYRPFLKKRLTEELKAWKPRSPEHESLSVDAARIQHYLDYDIKEFTRATAVFACYGDNDLFDAVQLPTEFPESMVTVGPLATLYPLLRAADCYRRAAVIVADTQSARLFSIALGSIELRREMRAAQAARGDGAIESERHSEDTVRKHVRLAAQSLEELANEVHASWILIGGEPGVAAEIEGALGPALQERVLGRPSWDIRIAESDLSTAVEELVDAKERSIRRDRADELVRTAPHEGALLGLGPVIQALAEARVATLLLSESFPADAPGWACRACRAFDSGLLVAACPVCGKAEVQAIALREELGSQALAQGADVHFVESAAVPGFDAAGGVGAYTRYP
jgi:hypothetical protein